MSDLISRQAAIDEIEQAIINHDSAIMRITNMPSADAVEVVRCVDCKHIEILNGQYYARCKWHGRLFDSFGKADIRTWFCADGRKSE